MSWWWAGMMGAAKRQPSRPLSYPSVALVVGSNTVVGASLLDILPLPDTPAAPWKVYSLPTAVSPPDPPAPADDVSDDAVQLVRCDISDPTSVAAALPPIAPELTHIFCVDDVGRPCGLKNVLAAVIPAAANLRHVCLVTGSAHYVAPAHEHEAPFREDLPRLDGDNPCHDLEDALLAELANSRDISWTVHRPGIIFGGGGSLVGALCAYAAICCKERRPLKWPGGRVAWEALNDASDADLVAEHLIWAAVEPAAGNEAFNCSNGDVFRWKHLWPVLAAQFGVEAEGYASEEGRFSLAEAMEGKDHLWEQIVAENALAPTALPAAATWGAADEVLNAGAERVHSMNKSKEYGFLGFRNTMSSFLSWIERLKERKMVP